ncbi:hypothetical protein Xen7305DRAFT_00024510 [Xenococcus sp. PCC 7305]|uniref:hypothetical protein n=1 Tax=Xenococcus sp. PCC 7305 TaxID=102125 RepID=UPI0002ACA28F|nr:hypothetical protein [Xenococcus sp. PCC 7305]ELS02733.1 hypothetical protein Xen7305DRAFT_00024510 [Xenococcus sp. PCC 7305]
MFNLSSDITYRQEQLPNGVAFMFRHSELGDLGRVLLQERPDGQTQILCEVVGDPDDPMTAKRGAIFEPIGKELSHQLDQALGGRAASFGNRDPHSAQQPPESIEKIASKLIPCLKCGRPAALLIFADYAQDLGGMEDYARLMYSKIVELNVPTWVIAPPEGTGRDAAANILKTYPEREPICKLTPDEFNERLDRITADHC